MKTLSALSLSFDHDLGRLLFLDQTKLPHEESWVECRNPDDMIEAIVKLRVRGAPLIGVAAALSLAQLAQQGVSRTTFEEAAEKLRAARPTAVNLSAAVNRCLKARDPITAAYEIFDEDVRLCDGMAHYGAPLIEDGDGIITYCNTGQLATVGCGTALGVIRRAYESGKRFHVYVPETRPLLQGSRLTTWELHKLGIPFTLICDNMMGFVMAQKKIDRAFVGADRIARNGDFANKIGTYSLSVLAKHHKIPFYVVAPHTTFDPNCKEGSAIPIEQRNGDEVKGDRGAKFAHAYNPAFDITPAELVSGWVLDKGFATHSSELSRMAEG